TGSAQARDVTGTLSTSQSGVSIEGSTMLYFGIVGGGSTACGSTSAGGAGYCSPAPRISVATSVAAGTAIPFRLQLADGHGNSFTVTFSYTTPAINQSFAFESITVDEDTNRDGNLSPGETGSLL